MPALGAPVDCGVDADVEADVDVVVDVVLHSLMRWRILLTQVLSARSRIAIAFDSVGPRLYHSFLR